MPAAKRSMRADAAARAHAAARAGRRRAIACGGAALAAGLVYVNALHNPFVYDDYRTIVENVSVQSPGSFRAILLHEVTRPIVNLSYAADRALWGPAPLGFHVTNVLLHVVNVVLLFQLASQLVDDWQLDNPPRMRAEVVAFTAAVLLAVHPMMTEAVGYISGRSEVLCATFFLLALMSGRRWMRGDGVAWPILTLLLWLAALATKEIAAMFPFVLACADWLVVRGNRAEIRRRMLTIHLPLIGTALVAGIARLAVFALLEHPGQTRIHWPYALMELDVIRRYAALMLVPVGQAMFHDVPAIRGVLDPRGLASTGVVVAMLAVAWRMRRTAGIASLGIIWFLLLLVPSSALVVLEQGEPMTEHRVYLASGGLFLAAGSGIGWLMARLEHAGAPTRLLARSVLTIGILTLGALTVSRNAVFASPVTLWREAVEQAPDHFRPRLLFGEALQDGGRRDEAVEQYRLALRLRPQDEAAALKLGLCLAEMGRLPEAAAVLQQLHDRDPHSAGASSGLAAVAMLAGDRERARDFFLEAIARDPRNVPARRSLAILDELEPADHAEALRLCEEIQRIAPETPGNDDCIRRNRSRLDAIGAGRR